MEYKLEGVIIQSIPYQEHDEILKVFTPNGLISLFAKGVKRRGKEMLPPFTLVDWVVEEGRGELFKLKEAKVIKSYLNLRNSLDAIEGAMRMGLAIQKTQAPGKEAKNLYALFLNYLERVDVNPFSYATSFWLKTLIHEGLIAENALEGYSEEDKNYVEALSFAKQRKLIEDLEVTPAFLTKIENLFLSSI